MFTLKILDDNQSLPFCSTKKKCHEHLDAALRPSGNPNWFKSKRPKVPPKWRDLHSANSMSQATQLVLRSKDPTCFIAWRVNMRSTRTSLDVYRHIPKLMLCSYWSGTASGNHGTFALNDSFATVPMLNNRGVDGAAARVCRVSCLWRLGSSGRVTSKYDRVSSSFLSTNSGKVLTHPPALGKTWLQFETPFEHPAQKGYVGSFMFILYTVVISTLFGQSYMMLHEFYPFIW